MTKAHAVSKFMGECPAAAAGHDYGKGAALPCELEEASGSEATRVRMPTDTRIWRRAPEQHEEIAVVPSLSTVHGHSR